MHARMFAYFGGVPRLTVPDYVACHIIRNHPERDAFGVLEGEQKASDERFDLLVRNDHHPGPAGELQAIGGEMDPLPASIGESHVGLPKVELGEFPSRAFKPDHQRGGKLLLLQAEDPIEGTLPQPVAFLPELTQELQWRRLRICGE
jgi:hypothetical protein